MADGGYAPANGLEMYYEVHGEGDPLVLLHGGFTTIDVSFGGLLPALSEDRRIVAVEQQAHGRTPDADRPLSFARMADDTAAVLGHLGIERADFFALHGYALRWMPGPDASAVVVFNISDATTAKAVQPSSARVRGHRDRVPRSTLTPRQRRCAARSAHGIGSGYVSDTGGQRERLLLGSRKRRDDKVQVWRTS
jgi:hypothetical protein